MSSTGLLIVPILLLFAPLSSCWNNDAVLLQDVQVLTLHRGRYTTARRSSPVLQLKCVGGSAGCSSFVPEVVQCYNRGSDGVDTQWECKADMDNAFRFGHVEVSCEGYSSPNDAYVLKGSCGLEYSLELTAEGKQQHSHGFSGFASSFFQGSSNHKSQSGSHYQQSSDDGVGGLVVFALLLLLAYGVYKVFLSNPAEGNQGHSGDGSQGFTGNWENNQGMGPPPPGFKPSYYSDHSSGPGYGFSNAYAGPQNSWAGFNNGNRSNGAGFWTGMGTGGVLGYLFGSQRRQPPMGSSGSFYSSKPSPSPTTSSGTRTASGFGGTTRR